MADITARTVAIRFVMRSRRPGGGSTLRAQRRRSRPGRRAGRLQMSSWLRRQLRGCRWCDIVLVDCPPSFGVLTLNAIAAASHLVVVTELSILALQGIEKLLELG